MIILGFESILGDQDPEPQAVGIRNDETGKHTWKVRHITL